MTEFDKNKLTEAELELIGSFLDGELKGEMADRVARRIEHDSVWAENYRQLQKLDDFLGSYKAENLPASFDAKLNRRIHRSKPSTYIKWAAPLAAAACIAFVSWLSMLNSGPIEGVKGNVTIAEALESLPTEDRFVIENLDWLQDYEMLSDFETVEELVRIDKAALGDTANTNSLALATELTQ